MKKLFLLGALLLILAGSLINLILYNNISIELEKCKANIDILSTLESETPPKRYVKNDNNPLRKLNSKRILKCELEFAKCVKAVAKAAPPSSCMDCFNGLGVCEINIKMCMRQIDSNLPF